MHVLSVRDMKKYATGHGHVDRLLRKAAGPQQMLPVQTLIEYHHSQESPDFKRGRRLVVAGWTAD